MGNHEEVQHQCQPQTSHQTPLSQGYQSSPLQWQQRRLGLNNSCSDRDVSSNPPSSSYFWKGSWQMPKKIIRALSALEAEHIQYWRQNNHQFPLCWRHQWLRRGKRTGKISCASRQSIHSLWHRYINAKKTKLMTNNTSGINREFKVNGLTDWLTELLLHKERG